jgi:MFS transporter, DHA3 family, tetracycline resistance protein
MFDLNPRKWPAETVYMTIAAITTLCFGLVFTVSGLYYVQTVKLSPLELVLVGTALELSIFVFEIPTGVVADVFSRRLSVCIGYGLIGLGFALQAVVPSFAAVLGAQVLWGVGHTFTSGALQAWLSDEIGAMSAARAFLRAVRLERAVSFVSIPLSIMLAFAAYQVPMALGGAGFVLLAVLLALTMPETGFAPAPREHRGSWAQVRGTFLDGVRVVRSSPTVITILLISVVFGAASESFDRLWQAHLLSFQFPTVPFVVSLGAPRVQLVWFGLIDLAVSLVALVMAGVASRRLEKPEFGTPEFEGSSRTATARMLLVLNAALIACLLVFALAPAFGLVLAGYMGARAIRTLIDPLSMAWLNARLESGSRATVLSINGQADAVGQVAGGPVIGWLGNASLRLALAVGALILTPALALYARALRQDAPALEVKASEVNLLE